MSSEMKIGDYYYNNLEDLMRQVANGKIKPIVIRNPDIGIDCYFCLNTIRKDVLVLKKLRITKDLARISRYNFHLGCYETLKTCSEKNISYPLMRYSLIDCLERRN